MSGFFIRIPLLFLYVALITATLNAQEITEDSIFRIAFGSCNKVDLPNPFWEDIVFKKPEVFIWGGDVIYADTNNMVKMQKMYAKQKAIPAYKSLIEKIPVLGTWDDHDYGINDGGGSYKMKKQSQNLFLDFLDVPKNAVE